MLIAWPLRTMHIEMAVKLLPWADWRRTLQSICNKNDKFAVTFTFSIHLLNINNLYIHQKDTLIFMKHYIHTHSQIQDCPHFGFKAIINTLGSLAVPTRLVYRYGNQWKKSHMKCLSVTLFFHIRK